MVMASLRGPVSRPTHTEVIDLTFDQDGDANGANGSTFHGSNKNGDGIRSAGVDKSLLHISRKAYERSNRPAPSRRSTMTLNKSITPPPVLRRSQTGQSNNASQNTPKPDRVGPQTVDLTLDDDEPPVAQQRQLPRTVSGLEPPNVASHRKPSSAARQQVLERPKTQASTFSREEMVLRPSVASTPTRVKVQILPTWSSTPPSPTPPSPTPSSPTPAPVSGHRPSPRQTDARSNLGTISDKAENLIPPKASLQDKPKDVPAAEVWVPRLPAPWHSSTVLSPPGKAKEWTAPELENALRSLSTEVERDHSRLVHHCLLSVFNRPAINKAKQISSHDDFAGHVLTPVDPKDEVDAMEFKFKVCGT
jgi:hypothetical protein